MAKNKMSGFEIRDELEQQFEGLERVCRECGKSGVIGKHLHVVYTESDMPFEHTCHWWYICESCQMVYGRAKKK